MRIILCSCVFIRALFLRRRGPRLQNKVCIRALAPLVFGRRGPPLPDKVCIRALAPFVSLRREGVHPFRTKCAYERLRPSFSDEGVHPFRTKCAYERLRPSFLRRRGPGLSRQSVHTRFVFCGEEVPRFKTKCAYQCRSLKTFRAEFRAKRGFTTRKSSSNSNSTFREPTPAAP